MLITRIIGKKKTTPEWLQYTCCKWPNVNRAKDSSPAMLLLWFMSVRIIFCLKKEREEQLKMLFTPSVWHGEALSTSLELYCLIPTVLCCKDQV